VAQVAGETTVPRWMFFTGAAAVFIGIGVVIWFAIPDIDARHRFVSPSGGITLELGENCSNDLCTRVIVKEASREGERIRVGCTVPLTETRPMLVVARPFWSADERSIEIAYADAEGVGGTFTLDLETDCTIAE
jgi:hypothetical protein